MMTFKIMGPLLVLSFTFLSNFPVLGMEESSESSENSAPPKNVRLKQSFLSIESNKKAFFNLRKETIMIRLFDELGYWIAYDEEHAKRYEDMHVKFIRKDDMTQLRLDEAREEARKEKNYTFENDLYIEWGSPSAQPNNEKP
jgi:hypothetical protein